MNQRIRKVTREVRLRWQGSRLRRCLRLARALVIDEEKSLVLYNWPTERATKLNLAEHRGGSAGLEK